MEIAFSNCFLVFMIASENKSSVFAAISFFSANSLQYPQENS